jgi:3',5'-cyclic AMP phosphodiesterase CpdA
MKLSFKIFTLVAVISMTSLLSSYSFAKPVENETGMFVVYGDTRSDAEAHAKVVNYLVSLKPEFLLQTGDLVDHGTNKAEWDEFNKIEQPITDAHIPDYPARGNHDIGPYYLKQVVQPYDSGNGYYYSFSRLGIRFIAIDCFSPFDSSSDQYKWIESQLIKAKANHETPIAFMHESPYSVGPHGDNMDVQAQLHPLFAKYHVPLVFCGHDHLYYHTKRDGVTYIVTGGGGAPLYPASNTQFGIPGDVYKTTYNAIKCEADDKEIKITALDLDSNVIDKLTISRWN